MDTDEARLKAVEIIEQALKEEPITTKLKT